MIGDAGKAVVYQWEATWTRCFRTLPKRQGCLPRRLITDRRRVSPPRTDGGCQPPQTPAVTTWMAIFSCGLRPRRRVRCARTLPRPTRRRGDDRKLIECCAELESGDLVDPTASVKHALRSLATRWLTLAAEISVHDKALDSITRTAAPTLREAFGIGPDASAEMMIVAGDNPSRIRSDAAFAKLCGACPIPASSGVTNRHRLFRGGHRQANATLYRIVIVRMRWHQPTIDDVARRTAQGLSKKDITRCLKRFVAREIYNALIEDHRLRAAHLEAA